MNIWLDGKPCRTRQAVWVSVNVTSHLRLLPCAAFYNVTSLVKRVYERFQLETSVEGGWAIWEKREKNTTHARLRAWESRRGSTNSWRSPDEGGVSLGADMSWHVPSFISLLLSVLCLLMSRDFALSFLRSHPRSLSPLSVALSLFLLIPSWVWQLYHPCLVCLLSLIIVTFMPTRQLWLSADYGEIQCAKG